MCSSMWERAALQVIHHAGPVDYAAASWGSIDALCFLERVFQEQVEM